MPLSVLPLLRDTSELGIQRESRLVDSLFTQTGPLMAGCIAYVAVVLMMWASTGGPVLLALAVLGTAVGVLRFRLVQAYGRARAARTPDKTTHRVWAGRFAVGACATAALWGAAAVALALRHPSPFAVVAIAMMQTGWLAGASVRNAASPLVASAQVLLSLGPAFFAMLLTGLPGLAYMAPFVVLQAFVALELSRFQAAQMHRLLLSEARLEAANIQLRQLTATDALTGIANRRGFDAALVSEWGRAAREGMKLSLLVIDVDHFKSYNDRYGHAAGDECLRGLAALARQVLRRPTDLVARYGGEEFVILLPATDQAGAMQVAERLRRAVMAAAIAHAATPGGQLTISVGVAEARPDVTEDPGTLFQEADRALYAAKRGGRNTVRAGPAVLLTRSAAA